MNPLCFLVNVVPLSVMYYLIVKIALAKFVRIVGSVLMKKQA